MVVKEKSDGSIVALLKAGGKWFLIIFRTSLGLAVASRVLVKLKPKQRANTQPQDEHIS